MAISLNSLAGVDGINPNKLKQKPFYLYKNLTVDKNKNIVDVDGFKYERSGNTIYITPEGNKSKLKSFDGASNAPVNVNNNFRASDQKQEKNKTERTKYPLNKAMPWVNLQVLMK